MTTSSRVYDPIVLVVESESTELTKSWYPDNLSEESQFDIVNKLFFPEI